MPRRFFMTCVKNEETKLISKKLKKSENGEYFTKIIYIIEQKGEDLFLENVKTGDIVEFDGEGAPHKITNFTPYSLAHAFKRTLAKCPELKLTIDLHACNSGTIAHYPDPKNPLEICFAQNFSQALCDLGLTNITVLGYTGYLNAKNPLKLSVSAEYEKVRAKVGHCRLEDARVTYQNGVQISKPHKILVTDYCYPDKTRCLEKYLLHKQKHEAEFVKTKSLKSSIAELQLMQSLVIGDEKELLLDKKPILQFLNDKSSKILNEVDSTDSTTNNKPKVRRKLDFDNM